MSSNNRKLVPKLLTEADGYTHEQAASLYVDPVEAYLSFEKNCLLVGPLGSGKTMMLKAAYSQQIKSANYHPVFVELSRWIGHIAAETHTYAINELTPRGKVVLDAMSLMIIVGLCESVGAFLGQNRFPTLWSLFPRSISSVRHEERQKQLSFIAKEALLKNEMSDEFPSVHTVASTLGTDIRVQHNKKLVFLVDQIDQVASQFFAPIANLLKRSGDYISVLATRPCPTAPHPEAVPRDIISGDSYSILHLGRSIDGGIPYTFVREFLQALPLSDAILREIQDRSTWIANLMWPSLRSAVELVVRFTHFRSQGVSKHRSWYLALADTAKTYEALLRDALRGWCNPNTMLKDWRGKIVGARSTIGRSYFLIPTNLVGDLKRNASERLIRMLLKNGVLLLGPNEHYVPGSIPRLCEVAPLLLVNTPQIDLQRFVPKPVTVSLSEKQIEKWVGGGPPPLPRIKRVFISYRMDDPAEKTPLIQILRDKFKSTIDIVSGENVLGSPRWSPEILDKIGGVDVVLCDLTVPRRNIFVEYGVAIGTYVYVIQCLSSQSALDLPAWITDRQFKRFHTDSTLNHELENDVASLLESDQNLKLSWRLDSSGQKLDFPRKEKLITCLGSEAATRVLERLNTQARESDFDFRFYQLSKDNNDLDTVIKATRSCNTLILIFDGTPTDYLTCVAGGILAAKAGRGKPLMLLFDISGGIDVIPSLLSSHPLAQTCGDVTELNSKFHERLEELKVKPLQRSRPRK